MGGDLLVAHNGHTFDVPVLRRLAAGLPGLEELVFFDTLPLARSLMDRERRSLEDLCAPVRRLAPAGPTTRSTTPTRSSAWLRHLGELRPGRAHARPHWCSCSDGSAWRSRSMRAAEPTPEERVLRDIALPAALGRYGGCLEAYAEQAAGTDAPSAEELIERLGGQRLLERMRADRLRGGALPGSVGPARQRWLRLERRADPGREYRAAAQPRRPVTQRRMSRPTTGRVSLLTLHATKGLEFSQGLHRRAPRTISSPAYRALENDDQHEIQEARRLLYVGMTRAKDRLVLTRASQRDGRADRRRPVPPRGGARCRRC